MREIVNIGVLAHVDAGKTTLTEQFFVHAGLLKEAGSVDKGSTLSDQLALEKERGISILNSCMTFEYNGIKINVIDTPGHIDFSSEVDRALTVLDVAVLIVSAVDGIQAQTLNIWEKLIQLNIPTLIFCNKVDQLGADDIQVFKDIQQEWKLLPFAFNGINDRSELLNFSECVGTELEVTSLSLENLAETDDEFLAYFLEGDIPNSLQLRSLAWKQVKEQNLLPILYGSAKQNLGVQELLEMLTKFQARYLEEKEGLLSVFKLEFKKKLGVLAHVRNYGREVEPKTTLFNKRLNKEVKLNQLYQVTGGKLTPVTKIGTNDIGLITCSTQLMIGDILGNDDKYKPPTEFHNESVLQIQVEANKEQGYRALGEALEILNLEDPQLEFVWYKEEREFHLKIQGPIQIEVLSAVLKTRFGIEATFNQIQVTYKETPKKKATGFVRYWMPKPCWAILTFEIEPLERGVGFIFDSIVSTNDVSQKYQNEVEKAIPMALKQGIKGWEVTDLKITLIKGEEHQVHSNPGDFLLATPMGVMQGLVNADTELLEPLYQLDMKFHADALGAISAELNKMRAQIGLPVFEVETVSLDAKVPVANALDFPITFNSITSGKGRLKQKVTGYVRTPHDEQKERPYKGVSPLDEAQWILHRRGAFKSEERN